MRWIAIGAVLATLGCGLTSDGGHGPAGLLRAWDLRSIRTAEGVQPVLTGTSVDLHFASGKAEGHAGCNRYSATYEARDQGRLSIHGLTATEMHCPSPDGVMQQEQEYVLALSRVSTYDVSFDSLRLRTAAGDVVLLYQSGCAYDESEVRRRAIAATERYELGWGEPTLTRYSQGKYYFEFATPGEEIPLLGPRAVSFDCSTGIASVLPRL